MPEYLFPRNQRAGEYEVTEEWDVPDDPALLNIAEAELPGLIDYAVSIGASCIVITSVALTGPQPDSSGSGHRSRPLGIGRSPTSLREPMQIWTIVRAVRHAFPETGIR